MQPGLPAIAAGPARLGADQAHAGAAGVVVHFPVGGVEGCDVFVGEEVRRAMRAVDDADVPVGGVLRLQGGRQCLAPFERTGGRREPQHIAHAQRAAAMAAEAAERKGGAAAHVRGHIQPTLHGEVAALSSAFDAPQLQYAACRNEQGCPEGHGHVIERRLHRGTGERDDGGRGKAQRCTGDGHFQRRSAFVVAEQSVGQPQGQRIHRA